MVREPESFAVTSSLWEPTTPAYRFTHDAMACEVRITILNQEAAVAHDAAQEAFEELDRLEQQLSRFVPGSDVWLISRLTPGTPLTVSICTLECLQLAARVHAETGGAFDVTVGALYECRLDEEGAVLAPTDGEIERARARTGTDLLEICEEDLTVAVKTEGVRVDFGGIGKGYAIDEMVKVLGEWDIDTALISAAGSTYCAMGCPPGRPGWRVALGKVESLAGTLPRFHLQDRALSGSGVLPDRVHILDPRTGELVQGRHAAWSAAPSAALADALSTAFLVMEVAEVEAYCRRHPEIGGMVAVLDASASPRVCAPGAPPTLARFGNW